MTEAFFFGKKRHNAYLTQAPAIGRLGNPRGGLAESAAPWLDRRQSAHREGGEGDRIVQTNHLTTLFSGRVRRGAARYVEVGRLGLFSRNRSNGELRMGWGEEDCGRALGDSQVLCGAEWLCVFNAVSLFVGPGTRPWPPGGHMRGAWPQCSSGSASQWLAGLSARAAAKNPRI